MALFKKLGSVAEICSVWVTLHSVAVRVPAVSSLQIVIKHGKNKKVHTPEFPPDVTAINSHYQVLVKVHRKGSRFINKVLKFQLLARTDNKTSKIGSASINLAQLLNTQQAAERMNLSFRRSGSLCVSLAVATHDASEASTASAFPTGSSQEPSLEQQRQEKKQKFLKRLQRLNSLENTDHVSSPPINRAFTSPSLVPENPKPCEALLVNVPELTQNISIQSVVLGSSDDEEPVEALAKVPAEGHPPTSLALVLPNVQARLEAERTDGTCSACALF